MMTRRYEIVGTGLDPKYLKGVGRSNFLKVYDQWAAALLDYETCITKGHYRTVVLEMKLFNSEGHNIFTETRRTFYDGVDHEKGDTLIYLKETFA